MMICLLFNKRDKACQLTSNEKRKYHLLTGARKVMPTLVGRETTFSHRH